MKKKELLNITKNTDIETETKLNDILDHDLWMNSKECLEYGLVDEIL